MKRLFKVQTCAILTIFMAAAAPAALAGERGNVPVFERSVSETRLVTQQPVARQPAGIELDLSGIEFVQPGASEPAVTIASQTASPAAKNLPVHQRPAGGGGGSSLAEQATNPVSNLMQVGLATVLFRSLDSELRHQGGRTWHRDAARNSDMRRYGWH
jgi:hypothetical protein